MKAVVAHDIDNFSVVHVDLDPPKEGEVLVRMKATGICHSDLSIINGTIPWKLPSVLGHEGAGIVEKIGEGVTQVREAIMLCSLSSPIVVIVITATEQSLSYAEKTSRTVVLLMEPAE